MRATSQPRTCTSDLLGGGDDRPEAHEVAALAQEQRFRLVTRRWGASFAGFGAELELAVVHRHLVPDLRASPSRNSQSETPAWRQVVEHGGRRVDLAEREPARWATFAPRRTP